MFTLLMSCWYLGSIHSIERAYVQQDIEVLERNLQHQHQRYMREQSALFLSKIPHKNIDAEQFKRIVERLQECVQNETEFNDVRAACGVALAHWNVLEATENIIQASQTMQKEDLFWMCYSLAKLRTPIAIAHLEKQQTRDILLQHGIQDWLQKKDPNLEFTPIFQEILEDVR